MPVVRMTLLPALHSIVQFRGSADPPAWALSSSASDDVSSITRLGDEHSVVCPTARLPPNLELTRSDGWRALRFEGPFDLNATGVLASVVGPLAQAGVSVFALATFDTDVVLVLDAQLPLALSALRRAGHHV